MPCLEWDVIACATARAESRAHATQLDDSCRAWWWPSITNAGPCRRDPAFKTLNQANRPCQDDRRRGRWQKNSLCPRPRIRAGRTPPPPHQRTANSVIPTSEAQQSRTCAPALLNQWSTNCWSDAYLEQGKASPPAKQDIDLEIARLKARDGSSKPNAREISRPHRGPQTEVGPLRKELSQF